MLGVLRPDLEVTLLDSSSRRIRFLEEALDSLGSFDPEIRARVSTAWGRAEELAEARIGGAADAVVARSFGPPAVVAECARRFVRAGGRLVVSEPPESSESRWPTEALDELGWSAADRRGFGVRFAVISAVGECPDRVPRRPGVPERRPSSDPGRRGVPRGTPACLGGSGEVTTAMFHVEQRDPAHGLVAKA
ncbi:MAG: RsmG family class I SAM-dependent methyltransferase [Microthrixaceae bacterium]